MAEQGRNLPKSKPLPVPGAVPPKGILVSSGGKSPTKRPAAPAPPAPTARPPEPTPPPRKNHMRAMLTGVLLLLVGAALFVAGMEIGYRRADSRYEPVVKDLNDAAKRNAEALHAKEQQLAVLMAKPKLPPAPEPASVSVKEATKPASPKVSSPLAEMLTKNAQASPPKTESEPKPPAKEPAAQVAAAPKPLTPEPAVKPAGKAALFAQDILPIFQSKCFTCHGNGKKKGGLDLRTLESVKRGGDSGAGVVAGKSDRSTVWEWIADDRMPPSKNKLTAAEKARVRDWIAQGGK